MAYQSGLSIYSDFAKKLGIAKEIYAIKNPTHKLSESARERQKQRQKEWRDRRKAENLAQRALIESKTKPSF